MSASAMKRYSVSLSVAILALAFAAASKAAGVGPGSDLMPAYKATGISGEQEKQIRALLTATEKSNQLKLGKVEQLRQEIATLMQQPSPDAAVVLKKQVEMDSVRADINEARNDQMIKIRAILTPEQRNKLLNTRLLEPYRHYSLTPEQEARVAAILREQVEGTQQMQTKVASLKLQCRELLLNPKIDRQAIFQRQQEIDDLMAKVAQRNVTAEFSVRSVLTADQLKMMFPDIDSPDSLHTDPINTYRLLDLSNAQKAQLRSLRDRYEQSLQEKAKAALQARLEYDAVAAQRGATEDDVMNKQNTLSRCLADVDDLRGEFAIDSRSVLTQDQLERLAVTSMIRSKLDSANLTADRLRKAAEAVSSFRSNELARAEQAYDIGNALRDIQWQPLPDEKLQLSKQSQLNALQSQSDSQRLKLMIELRALLSTAPYSDSDVDVYDLTTGVGPAARNR